MTSIFQYQAFIKKAPPKQSSCFLDYPMLHHVVFVQVLLTKAHLSLQNKSILTEVTREMLFTHLSAPTRFD